MAGGLLGKLAVAIVGDTKDLEKNFKGVTDKVDGFSKKMKNMGTSVTNAGKSLLPLTGVITAAGAGLFALAQNTANAGDQIQKMALRTGFSTEALSEYKHAADLSGTSIESLENGVKRMQRSIFDLERGLATQTEAYQAMGLTIEDVQGLSPEKQFEKITMALAEVDDASKRAALAQQIFGRAGTELLPMLASGADGIAAMRQEAHDLGIVFDQESADAAAQFNDDLDRLKKSFTGVFQELAKKLIPVFVDTLIPMAKDTIVPLLEKFVGWISRLAEWFKNLSPTMQKIILGAIGLAAALGPVLIVVGQVITAIGAIAPVVAAVGGAIGAVAAGPIALIVAAIAALIAIIILVIKYWDEIVAAFKTAWQWLKDVFAAWWETFSEFWIGIWETVKSALLAAWEWIKDLFLQYHPVGLVISHWDTIKEFFSGLWDRVKEIFSGAMQAIGNFITDKFNAVVGFLTSIRDKIISVFNTVRDRIKSAWESIVGSIKGAINSVISAINGMIGRINKIRVDIPDWVPEYGGRTIGFNIPKIPKLATGGDILRAGAAIVGERGPEIVHLPQGAQVRPLGSAKDVNLNISFSGLPPSVDEEALKSYLVRIIKEPRVMRTIDEALYENRRSNLAPQGAF